jgi:hypothetical protein
MPARNELTPLAQRWRDRFNFTTAQAVFYHNFNLLKSRNQGYEPTGQAPADIPPQGAGNLPKEIKRFICSISPMLPESVAPKFHQHLALDPFETSL